MIVLHVYEGFQALCSEAAVVMFKELHIYSLIRLYYGMGATTRHNPNDCADG